MLCYASQRSPAYEDVLREGDVVMVGDESGEFVQVILPLGVVGYVHKDFTTAPVNGVISTTRPRVSFRYRPQTGEAPTQLLEEGTPLRYVAGEDSWWKVRMVPQAAWLPIKEVQVFQEASPTLVKSYEALRQVREEQCTRAGAEFAAEEARQKRLAAQLARLEELRKEVAEAAKLPDREQLEKLTALEGSLDELKQELKQELPEAAGTTPAIAKDPARNASAAQAVATTAAASDASQGTAATKVAQKTEESGTMDKPAPSPVAVDADRLAARIRSQRLAATARLLLEEPPKPATDVAPGPRLPSAAPRSRFATTGWVRFDEDAAGHLRCRLEKGGKTVAYITCSNRCYELQLFDGLEVGVSGSKTWGGESWGGGPALAPVIDAVRLEVLTVAPD